MNSGARIREPVIRAMFADAYIVVGDARRRYVAASVTPSQR